MKPAIIYSRATKRFAFVEHSLAPAMLYVGNTEGFDAIARKPSKEVVIRIRQIRSGLCAVDLLFPNGDMLSHESGRVAAKKLANAIGKWTGGPIVNVKVSGTVVPVPTI